MSDDIEVDVGCLQRQTNNFHLSPRVRADASGYLTGMVSYAQNFEDVILRRALQEIEQGFYIDIGAWHPIHDSVTAWFYDTGWHGINVEPNPQYFTELERARTRDTNLQCVVGASGETCLFTVIEGTGLSSGVTGGISGEPSIPRRIIPVPGVTLDQLFGLVGNNTVDFLKIDAEGMEADILNPASFTVHRPRIIVVEATEPNTQIANHQSWEPQLLAKNYIFVLFDGLNRFYVSGEEAWRRDIFAAPPCVFDNFAVPTLQARLRPLEDALAQSDGARAAAVQGEAALTTQLRETAGRNEALAAALARSDAECQAAREAEAAVTTQLQEAAGRNVALAAALAGSDAECQAAREAEAAVTTQLQETAGRNEALAVALVRSDAECQAVREAEAALTAQFQETAGRNEALAAALARSDAECQAAREAEVALTAQLQEAAEWNEALAAALARLDAECQAVREAEAVLTTQLQKAAGRNEALAVALVRLDAECQAVREAEAMLTTQLQKAAERNEALAVALVRSDAECQATREAEAALDEEVRQAARRNEALAAALARSGEELARVEDERRASVQRETAIRTERDQALLEAAAWEEACAWKPADVKVPQLLRLPPFQMIYWRRMLRQAQTAAKRRDWVEAVELYGALLTVKPNHQPRLWVQYGHAYKECGALAKAALAYRRGLILSPDHPDAAHHLAYVMEVIRDKEGLSADSSPPDCSPHDSPTDTRLESPAAPMTKGAVKPRGHSLLGQLVFPGHALAEDDPLVRRNLILRDMTLAVPVRWARIERPPSSTKEFKDAAPH